MYEDPITLDTILEAQGIRMRAEDWQKMFAMPDFAVLAKWVRKTNTPLPPLDTPHADIRRYAFRCALRRKEQMFKPILGADGKPTGLVTFCPPKTGMRSVAKPINTAGIKVVFGSANGIEYFPYTTIPKLQTTTMRR